MEPPLAEIPSCIHVLIRRLRAIIRHALKAFVPFRYYVYVVERSETLFQNQKIWYGYLENLAFLCLCFHDFLLTLQFRKHLQL